jgi:eukaryotic-like serine/threonine-protein kinase
MRLRNGTELGPYDVVVAGAGGMGEVYRARDSRLNGEVAIKVLPAQFSRDPDRVSRFRREAQAAAALNHPNILAILDLGEHDGSVYIVAEMLEGETLRAGVSSRTSEGHRSPRLEAGKYFHHVRWTVKILDFGLAKLTRPEGVSPTDGRHVSLAN